MSGHRYTVSVDTTFDIRRIEDDALGPGQHIAVAAIEFRLRIFARDRYAKTAATSDAPVEEIPEG